MKTLYKTLLAGVLFVSTASAQITLLATWHEPQANMPNGVKLYDSSATAPIPKASGSQSWDFSGLSMRAGAAMITNYAAATGVPSASLFAGATLVADHGAGEFSYYNAGTAKLELLGTWSGTGSIVYSDAKTVMMWPTTSSTTYTDNFAATRSTPTMTSNISGTLSSSASGFGTLILPGGAMMDSVMQITTHKMTTLADTGAMPNNTVMTSHIYTYISSKQRYPIIVITYNSSMDSNATAMKSYSAEVNHLLAVGLNRYSLDASFALYPNPATESLNVKLNNGKSHIGEMEFYNITGQLVKKVNLGNSTAIESLVDIKDLSSGVYMVKTSLGDQSSVKRLIVH